MLVWWLLFRCCVGAIPTRSGAGGRAGMARTVQESNNFRTKLAEAAIVGALDS